MASLAGELRVPLPQREFGILVVVEGGLLPIVRRMAGGARRTQAALVHIVGPVAGDTGLVQLLRIDVALVAILAFQPGVLAFECEFRVLVVVEADLAPVLRRMTALAFLTIASLVLVIRAVTGDAGFGQFLFVQIARVTGIAANRLVLAGKGE